MMVMIGDVQVVGLVPETVQLADIGMDVPHGVAVWIPGAKAQGSRDLWMAVSQRRVIKIGHHSHPTTLQAVAPKSSDDVSRLQARIATLETEKATLEAALMAEKAKTEKLDEILQLLRLASLAPAPLGSSNGVQETSRPPSRSPVVDVEAPMFIPSQIKGDSSDARVSVSEGTAEGGGVSDAREALRRMRKTGG